MSDQNNYGQIPSSNQNNYGNAAGADGVGNNFSHQDAAGQSVSGQNVSGQNQPPAYEGNYGNAGQYGYAQPGQQNQSAQNQPASNQSAQNQSAQNQYGNAAPASAEQGNGYSQTQQPPSYSGAMGYSNGAAPEKPATPKSLKIASWLIYLTVLIGVIATIYQVANPDLIADQAGLSDSELQDAGMTTDQMNRFLGFGIWVGVAFAVIQYALTIMFTLFMLGGANWARIVLTVICGLGCFSLFAIPLAAFAGTPMLTAVLSTVSALACVGAIIFMFLRPSNQFFAKMRELKQWRAFNQYQ